LSVWLWLAWVLVMVPASVRTGLQAAESHGAARLAWLAWTAVLAVVTLQGFVGLFCTVTGRRPPPGFLPFGRRR
jgi:hypothetical protein